MALQSLMHPRNIYKNRRPDFKKLAEKYPEFEKHMKKAPKGKLLLDFKNPDCLRALSWALLKEDFDLDVEMPLDRLIPTVPLRLNYILWVEDLLASQAGPIKGIDIGAGASCVYPLLGAKKNNWHFLASEADATNAAYAECNVKKNNLTSYITVKKVDEDSGLYELVHDIGEDSYNFSMCNPPFFGTSLEAWGGISRTETRTEPKSVNTASPQESVVPGGEVNFVKRMIDDSLMLKDRVRVYTTMLGKKTSLMPLKVHLRNNGVTNIGLTEFCQGRTMRWGLGWSFDDSIKFPKPPSKKVKDGQPKPPLVYKIPHQMSSVSNFNYSVPYVGAMVMALLEGLKIVYEPEKSTMDILVLELVARAKTWSNQRRKRRQGKVKSTPEKQAKTDMGENLEQESENSCEEASLQAGSTGLKCSESVPNSTGLKCSDSVPDKTLVPDNTQVADQINKPDRSENTNAGHVVQQTTAPTVSEAAEIHDNGASSMLRTDESDGKDMCDSSDDLDMTLSIEDIEDYLVRCRLTLLRDADDILLQLSWLNGDKESMYQILQYLKNKLV